MQEKWACLARTTGKEYPVDIIIHSSFMMDGAMCKCPHHKIAPLSITLIGLAFLANALGYLASSTLAVVWPVLLTIIGLMKLSRGMCGCDMKKM